MLNVQARFALGLRRQKGLTLLELVFALAVIAVLIVLSVSQYKRYAASKDLAAVRYNVDQIFMAANQCFWMNRNSPNDIPANCTKKKLQVNNLWPTTLLLNNNKLTPSDDDYDVGIAAITGMPTNFLVTVSATFPSDATPQLMAWYVSKLNATSFSAATLSWKQVPTYSVPTSDTNLWINNAQLQQFRNIEQPPPPSPP